MQIKKLTDPAFRKYGRILPIDTPDLLKRLAKTVLTEDVEYVASVDTLEASAEFSTICNSIYGGMPIQIGYCNGNNHKLNAVEYHRDSEVDIPVQGCILILGSEQDIEEDFTYDTAKMEAFEVPAGTAVEIYGTTLHYAPCNLTEEGFQTAIILPRGTNTEKPELDTEMPEDRLMTAKNKWLIAHEESGLKKDGAFVGLKGANLEV
ncbi:DUF4867 family protein [Blautia liquoris]|uniref:DUF4867 family protein n=1 Tax=Blautia liquoris TaxID=2779518 RepID=A0A7M2RL06_9FIRM|nr:DUF4867 family protein [Blautia liquoris]QOV20925.1 DUF4867 family protein [Blautia liquoris]